MTIFIIRQKVTISTQNGIIVDGNRIDFLHFSSTKNRKSCERLGKIVYMVF